MGAKRIGGVETRVSPADYPWYVKFARLGARKRSEQWAWFWFAIVLTAIVLVFALVNDSRFFVGVIFLLSSAMNWFTINWMDLHGDWNS